MQVDCPDCEDGKVEDRCCVCSGLGGDDRFDTVCSLCHGLGGEYHPCDRCKSSGQINHDDLSISEQQDFDEK